MQRHRIEGTKMTGWDREAALTTLRQGDVLFDQWMEFWRQQIEPLIHSEEKEIGVLALDNIVSFRLMQITYIVNN